MKCAAWVFCLIASVQLSRPCPLQAQALLLSEIDPGGGTEWVELHNPSPVKAEPLDEYILEKESVDGKADRYRLPAPAGSEDVPPLGYVVVCVEKGAGQDLICEAPWCTSGLCLSFDLDRDGGVISLYRVPECRPDLSALIDSVRYPPCGSGATYGRAAPGSDWCILEVPTPGLPNAPCHDARAKVVLNEVCTTVAADPGQCGFPDDCPDWVELHWLGPEPVDLAGFRVSSRGTGFEFPQGTLMDENHRSILLVCRSSAVPAGPCSAPVFEVPFALRNDGDSLELRAPGPTSDIPGELWDSVAIPGMEPGQLFARFPDGAAWAIVTEPTPCGPNKPPPGKGLPPRCKVFDRFPLRVFPQDPVQVYAVVTDPDGDLLEGSIELRWGPSPDAVAASRRMFPAKSVTCRREPEQGIFAAEIPAAAQVGDVIYVVAALDAQGNPGESLPLSFFVQDPVWQNEDLSNPIHLLRINEVAANEANAVGDWVEIYNPTDSDIRIGGMYLTDRVLKLDGTQLPVFAVIPRKSRYIVWCDNNSLPDENEPHLPFLLDKCRGEVVLFHTDGKTVVDSVMFHEEKVKTTLGRFPDGGDSLSIMPPTPREPNRLSPCVDYRSRGSPSPIVINEVLSDNWKFPDAGGEYGDWIELFNRSGSAVLLDGWTLRDEGAICREDPLQPLKAPWAFPAGVVLPAHGHRLLWCDNDTCENSDGDPGADLHTDFELNRLAEYLELVNPAGIVMDSVCLHLQARDTSLGRFPDGVDSARALEPTPGFPNKLSGLQPRLAPCPAVAAMLDLSPAPPCATFFRGDAQADCGVNITDAIFVLSWLFLGGQPPACPDAADANDTGNVDISDAIYTLGFLFLGGPPPAAPRFPAEGHDATWDPLPTCESVSCP